MKVILLIALIMMTGCETAMSPPKAELALYQSIDWITDGVFTQGIEGPAVALDGNLYVVNYQQEGTIGRVTGKNKVEEFMQKYGE